MPLQYFKKILLRLNSSLALLTVSLCIIGAIVAGSPVWLPASFPKPGHVAPSLLRRKISDSNSHPQVIADIHNLAGCPGEICGTLSGDAITPLLAGAGECAQQDMADKMIDIAKSQLQDKSVQKKLIELAKIYRQTERNTFPAYSLPSTPDTNSLYCQKAPKNSELTGLVQKQSSAADPNLFFDPKANGNSLQKGSDPRTVPFGQSKENSSKGNPAASDNDKDLKPEGPSQNQTEPKKSKSSSGESSLTGDDLGIEPRVRKSTASSSNNTNPEEDDDVDEEKRKTSTKNEKSKSSSSKSSSDEQLGENKKKTTNDGTIKSTGSRNPEPKSSTDKEDGVTNKKNKAADGIGECERNSRAKA